MKEIKDYLHLYLGCKSMEAIKVPGQELQYVESEVTVRTLFNCNNGLSVTMPILRPLSSMTKKERQEYRDVSCDSVKGVNMLPEIKSGHFGNEYFNAANPEIMRWLLSKHFDLFGLIEAGLAIDATTLKTPA